MYESECCDPPRLPINAEKAKLMGREFSAIPETVANKTAQTSSKYPCQ